MLKSMTGFGRSERTTPERKFVVELKAVNHRYCDITIKMPKKLGFFEAGIRTLLKQYISRGKIDVFISYEDYTEQKSFVHYNKEIAQGYVAALKQMASDFDLKEDVSVTTLSRYPDVFTLEEMTLDENELWEDLSKTIQEAVERFSEARILEGEHLKADMLTKLRFMSECVAFIEERSPAIVTEYREKLHKKVEELLGDTKLDEGILATEITVFADKICVDEETVRLKSHMDNTIRTLEEADNIGRKLDFIAQEMNREANTILSKANDLEVTNRAIDLKTEIEKLREQIQNIE
ncbi:MAG: hypothetical protein PWP24_1829 [Clostridiales bacterium]|nr:hypothetical protein [Clostridiales bacterium]